MSTERDDFGAMLANLTRELDEEERIDTHIDLRRRAATATLPSTTTRRSRRARTTGA